MVLRYAVDFSNGVIRASQNGLQYFDVVKVVTKASSSPGTADKGPTEYVPGTICAAMAIPPQVNIV